jgi:hypothetical protein
MSRKHLSTLLVAATLAIGVAGCASNKPASEIPHTLKVVDAVTKLPVAGANVKLTAPGMTMVHRTDTHGMIDVGTLTFQSKPKPEHIEVTNQDYNPVSFRLTNGLPPTVEITPLQSSK